jgi:predicted nucleic acid-binding protein
MIMLDTSVLISAPRFDEAETYGASMIALAELHLGIQTAPTVESRSVRVRTLAFYRATIEWIAFDERAAESYGTLADVVRRTRAAHARSKDILMASQAHSLGVPFVTRNAKDFELISHLVEIREIR